MGLEALARDELVAALVMALGRIEELTARVAELQDRLNRDSSNSSQPPSSDGPYRKPPPKASAMRRKSGRKPGKQHGDPGTTRHQVADPDEVIECPPPECRDCGMDLADAPVFGVSKRQVFEVAPPPPPKVTEYRVISKTCPCCGTVTAGPTPPGASGRVQWGPGVKARAVLTVMAHHVPFGRAKRLLRDLAGINCATGWLVNVRRQAAAALEPFMARIQQILHTARLLHVDETTARAAGKLAYLHVACNDRYTAMHIGGRGIADIDAGKILDGFAGILVRDGYGGYTHLVDAVHVWCGAHTLRDLKAVHDADPEHQQGTEAMANTLVLALKATHDARRAGRDTLSEQDLREIRCRYAGAIAAMRSDNTLGGTPLQQRGLTLANRFDKHHDMILAFIYDLTIPFTNNPAELEVRGAKVRQRVSGCWRTLAGLADYAVIWSYLSTAAKHGIDHLDALTQLFTDGPWLPPVPGTP
ncbi:IS66 family transposase [Kitasatospora sp. NBC_01287]|uniref:IS66 family transposase n=1 Tax=Kitasatospora sp. NBC_01287 TaxID=2903573 RepID=UPI0022593756|nr:IS66 family transposase [Kitasatospora sp. NBC_01287]MCX4749217.1 IS66 family transposase [Kitasatospora sp. NBC_01287]